jgi:hypothetical protein
MPASSNSVAQARLREALNAGGPGTKEKGPPVADGSLSVTPDTPEAIEFRSRRSVIDSLGASSSGYLEDETGVFMKFCCEVCLSLRCAQTGKHMITQRHIFGPRLFCKWHPTHEYLRQ